MKCLLLFDPITAKTKRRVIVLTEGIFHSSTETAETFQWMGNENKFVILPEWQYAI